ncbi:MAG: DivIVA domain-containing protein [Proteobacteria bacterium]|nr:DivIVA domain-containing protein [Pseudomonadota bacterium]MBU1716423.1 DivIVA domain-containing protein [Pseudomonadota bacterium]
MTMTPQEIQSKQFHVRMRGFDVEEVDGFLEKIAEEFLILTLENKQYLQKIEGLEKEIANYRGKETAFQQAIMSAQKISEEMQFKSKSQAEQTLANARQEAEELQNRTQAEANQLQAQSREEANQLQARAKAEAERIQNEAVTIVDELKAEISGLSAMKNKIQNDLRQLLQNYLNRINEEIPAGLQNITLPEPPHSDNQITELSPQTSSQDSLPKLPEDDLSNIYEKLDLIDETTPEMLFPEETEDIQLEDHLTDSDAFMESTDLVDFTLEDNAEEIEMPAMTSRQEAEIALPDFEESSELDEELTIPEIDGNMLFSLEDPLDDLGPAVSIADEDKK